MGSTQERRYKTMVVKDFCTWSRGLRWGSPWVDRYIEGCDCSRCATWREHFYPIELIAFANGGCGIHLVVGGDLRTLKTTSVGELSSPLPSPFTWDRDRIVSRQELGFIGLIPKGEA